MPEPVTALRRYHCTKNLLAGEIIEVTLAGCYVENANGSTVLRRWEDAADAQGAVPSDFFGVEAGDFWCVDGVRQFCIRRAEFCTEWLAHVAPGALGVVTPGTARDGDATAFLERTQGGPRKGLRRNRLSLTALLLMDNPDDQRRYIELPPLPREGGT